MAESLPTTNSSARATRPETKAWITLVIFFFVFCGVVAGACTLGWRYYATAMMPAKGMLVRVHAPTGVYYQSKGSTRRDTPVKPCEIPPSTDTCQAINEDDRVLAVPQAGYGPVASIALPGVVQVDMFPFPDGADLALKNYQVSRWTNTRQEVRFQHSSGYARYDLPSKDSLPYEELAYSVDITQSLRAELSPGGSYSIDVPQKLADRRPRLTDNGQPLLVEIAVRTGSAELHDSSGTIIIHPNQKLQIDTSGQAGELLPAQWELIRDGKFVQYANDGYLPGAQAWEVGDFIFDQSVTDAEKNAQFRVYPGCQPTTPAFCSNNPAYLAQFQRQGNQAKSFGRGIEQKIDLDVSEYRTLNFAMWARVINQSVPNAGITNNECPVTVRINFRQNSPTDELQTRYICFYRSTTDKQIPPSGQFVYQAVDDQPLWYKVSFDLRDLRLDLLKSARYIESVAVYGNGHDYISEVTDISLVATQTR